MYDKLYQLYENLPNDLDLYLSESELKYKDITEHTEKKIVWHSKTSEKTPLSIIYIHGYSATRQEVSPLVENLANRFKANLFLTRLTGHGRGSDAMAEVTLEKLLADMVEAFRIGESIGERVVIVATSTGATLATWLAANLRSDSLEALVFLSPNYGLKNRATELLTYPYARKILPLLFGKDYHFETSGVLQEKYWTTRYPTTALIPMMQLVNITRSSKLIKLVSPLLVLYSENDTLINVAVMKSTIERMGSPIKNIQHIPETQGVTHHVLAGDIQSPLTTAAVETRITNFLASLIN